MDISRSSKIFNPAEHAGLEAHVVGCGATGSAVALHLAKLKFPSITLWDGDTIEDHNVANQAFLPGQVGRNKAEALAELLGPYPSAVSARPEMVLPETAANFSGVVFLLTDTMASRREIFHSHLRLRPRVNLVVETRMGTDNGRVYAFRPLIPSECTWWESTLCEDATAEESACGTAQSVYSTAQILAGYAVWRAVNFLRREDSWAEFIWDVHGNVLTN